jgi:hypothetical protein
MNSVAPATKRAPRRRWRPAGGRYVDVAIMAPVNPARLAVPLLLSGAEAAAAAKALAALGFSHVRVVGPQVGEASSIKMIRSVIVKGIEALTAEAMLAAHAAGVAGEVLRSLDGSERPAPWAERADYNLDRMLVHGRRRAEEMEEVVRTLEGLGVEPLMTRATVTRQREIRKHRPRRSAGGPPRQARIDRRKEGGRGMTLVIDCHGHYTTAPAAHNDWRERQKAAFAAGSPPPLYPSISDDEIRDTLEKNQLRLLRERGAT